MDPLEFLDQGREEHLISVAVLKKASELDSKNKIEEYKVLSQLISNEFAKTMSKIL